MLIYKSDDFNKENKKILSRERKSHLHLRFFRDGEKPTFYLDFFGVCSTYLRSLYLRCDMSTNPKLFSSKSCCFFFKKCNIDSILCCVQIYEKNSRFHGKTARYGVLKIQFVDISHRRYKLRRDIE